MIMDKTANLYFAKVPGGSPVPTTPSRLECELFSREDARKICVDYYGTYWPTQAEITEATASEYMSWCGRQNTGKPATGRRLIAAQRNGRKGGRPKRKVEV